MSCLLGVQDHYIRLEYDFFLLRLLPKLMLHIDQYQTPHQYCYPVLLPSSESRGILRGIIQSQTIQTTCTAIDCTCCVVVVGVVRN